MFYAVLSFLKRHKMVKGIPILNLRYNMHIKLQNCPQLLPCMPMKNP